MWACANLGEALRHDAAAYGFDHVAGATFDWARAKARRNAYVARLNGIYEGNVAKDGVVLVHPTCGPTQVSMQGAVLLGMHWCCVGGRIGAGAVEQQARSCRVCFWGTHGLPLRYLAGR